MDQGVILLLTFLVAALVVRRFIVKPKLRDDQLKHDDDATDASDTDGKDPKPRRRAAYGAARARTKLD